MSIADKHISVMRDRCVELLSPALTDATSIVIDGTLGMGGHTEAILETTPARVIGIDRDTQAIALASERLARFGDRFTPFHGTYDQIDEALAAVGAIQAQGILLDLGLSSLQIDEQDRGFSYAKDAPLDMRMDQSEERTAADILNNESEQEIARILREYGEERFARNIAKNVARFRSAQPLERSSDFVELIRQSIPMKLQVTGGNPAKRSFQALRIAVNRELEILDDALEAAVAATAIGGRVVVMSYHSLEDRRVKHIFARGTVSSAPAGLPVVPDTHQPYLAALTRGAELASEAEIEANPRSKPVRLRAVERLRETPSHLRRTA